MRNPLVILFTLVLGCAMASTQAQVPLYGTPQIHARSNLLVNDAGYNLPPGSSFNSISATLNNQLHVAFPVQVVPNGASSNPGVWLGAQGSGMLVHNGPVDAFISPAVSINASDFIVFTLADTGGQDGIYRYDPATQVASRIGTAPLFPLSYGSVQINTAGAIAYQGNFGGGRAWASQAGGFPVIHVADQGLVPESPYTYLYTPAFNDARVIAGKVATSPDLVANTEVRRFATDGSSVRMAANIGTDASSPIKQFDNSLALNASGSVAFVATRQSDNRRVVYRSDGGSLIEIAVVDPAGTIRAIEFFAPALNQAGLVAFRAQDAAGQAIYVGDGTGLRRVIGKNDLVMTDLGLGQIAQDNEVDAVFAGSPALNDRGDVAFVAALRPPGQPLVEWGSGVFVAHANEALFADGFD